MSYTYVSSTASAAHTLSSFTINAGESLIIRAYDPSQINSTLTITDGTNTYTVRGTRNETNGGSTHTLIDCLAPTPGTYTLTINGSLSNAGYFIVSKYKGLGSYSAGSFASFQAGASPPTTTDGCTTSTITPTALNALLYSSGTCIGTFTAGTGFTSRAGLLSGPEFFIEDLEIIAGASSHIASWTMTAGGTNVVVIGAAYLETGAGVGDNLTTGVNTDLVLYNQNWNYSSAASTNFILVGTTGAFCNNQSGSQFVLATWQGQQFSADQEAQVTLASFVSGAQAGPCVRASNGASGPNGYAVFFDAAHYNIGKLVNGAFTSLTGGQQARTSNPSDIVLLQVQGTTITVFVNGVTLNQVTDSTWASGSPGIAFTGVHPSTVISTFRAQSLGILVPPYAVTTTIGQLSDQVVYSPTHQTGSFTVGALADATSVNLGSLTLTFAEGQLVDFLSIGGQTATFAEGTIAFTVTGGATFNLGAQSLGGTVGLLADEIDYILDQNAIIVIGQNATFSEGQINFTPTYSFSSYTITDTNGTILSEVDEGLTAQSITSAEGLIVATTGTTTSVQLTPQNIVSSEGLTSSLVIIDPVTGQTLTSAEGHLTFSNTGNFMATLAGQFGSFVSGSIALNIIPVTTSGYPNLAGLILEDATQRLEVAGAIVPASIGYFGTWPITVNWVPSQTVPPFVVLSQSIPPLAPIVPNAPIVLVVSQPNESVAYP